MALFIANLAFAKELIDSAKLGIFAASLFSAVAGVAFLRCVASPKASRADKDDAASRHGD
jgi:Na+:H+ antiporter, NhaA family